MADNEEDDTSWSQRPDIDRLPDPVFAVGLDGVLRYANPRAADVLAWDRSVVIGTQVLDLVHPDDANIAVAAIATVGDKVVGDIITLRIRAGDGTWRQLELRGAVQDFGGEPVSLIVARDTADRHRFDLDQGEVAVLRSVMANMNSMVAIVEPEGRIRSVNDAVTRLLGHDPELLAGQDVSRLFHPDDRDAVLTASMSLAPLGSTNLDARFAHLDGSWVTSEFVVKNLVDDPSVRGFIVSGGIAPSLSAARSRAEFLAEHDSRTGLRNRDGFSRAVRELIEDDAGLGLMVVDIASFRSINHLYGESIGDAVLAVVAERLDAILWPDIVTARFGGDEFVLAVRSTSDATIEMLRRRVVRELTTPMSVGDLEIRLDVRTATAFDDAADDLDALLATASSGLMRSKRSHSPSTVAGVGAVTERRANVEALRDAMSAGDVRPFFQPIVDRAGIAVAAEALVRWVHPDRGVLDAGEFLPLAHMAGLTETIDHRVFEGSVELVQRLAASGHSGVQIHVNVDPRAISRSGFAEDVDARCRDRHVDPRQLVVELTENDLLAPDIVLLSNLAQLRESGIHVAIDDFGTGYSSLAHLLELPVDGMKIDRRFVAGITDDPKAANLTRAILGLSDNLGLECVAEGVEDQRHHDRLAAWGCSRFQGYLYSRAVPADEFVAMLPHRGDAARTEISAEPARVR